MGAHVHAPFAMAPQASNYVHEHQARPSLSRQVNADMSIQSRPPVNLRIKQVKKSFQQIDKALLNAPEWQNNKITKNVT
jgi:hypothetical protein